MLMEILTPQFRIKDVQANIATKPGRNFGTSSTSFANVLGEANKQVQTFSMFVEKWNRYAKKGNESKL
jgi:hypothetical protein